MTTKADLLKKYGESCRKVHDFVQLDGWVVPDDDVTLPDEDGDCLTARRTSEVRASSRDLAVRVLVHVDADPHAAARILRKLADWYERDKERDLSCYALEPKLADGW